MSSLVLIVLAVAAAAVLLLIVVGVLALLASRGGRGDADASGEVFGVVGEPPGDATGLRRA